MRKNILFLVGIGLTVAIVAVIKVLCPDQFGAGLIILISFAGFVITGTVCIFRACAKPVKISKTVGFRCWKCGKTWQKEELVGSESFSLGLYCPNCQEILAFRRT